MWLESTLRLPLGKRHLLFARLGSPDPADCPTEGLQAGAQIERDRKAMAFKEKCPTRSLFTLEPDTAL
jgi:hypothetical protein